MSRYSAMLLLAAFLGSARPGLVAAKGIFPLNEGVYVHQDVKPCNQAPLADVMSYAGKAIFGAHDSKCDARILSSKDFTYKIDVTCRGAGNGAPVVPSHQLETLTRITANEFTLIVVGQKSVYFLCPGFATRGG